MSIAALIRQMAAAGAPPEAIAIAVDAIEAAQASDAERRAVAAERKRRQRDRERDSHGTVTGQSQTKGSPSSPKVSPKEYISNPLPNPTIPSKMIDTVRGADAFDLFWKAYPNRKGKEAARKAWAVAAKRGVAPDRIMAGLHRFAEHPPDDPQFIPHPATWLNQGRYDDEPMEMNDGNSMGRNIRQGNGERRPSASLDWIERNLGRADGSDEGAQGLHSGACLALPRRAGH